VPHAYLLHHGVGDNQPSGARKVASRLPSCWTEGGKADREGARKCGRVRVGELLWAAQDGLSAPTWVSVLSRVKGERQETSISSNVREESQVADAKAAMIVAFQVSACSRCGSRFERGRQDGTGEPAAVRASKQDQGGADGWEGKGWIREGWKETGSVQVFMQ